MPPIRYPKMISQTDKGYEKMNTVLVHVYPLLWICDVFFGIILSVRFMVIHIGSGVTDNKYHYMAVLMY